MNGWLKNYKGIIWLLAGIMAGSAAGLLLGGRTSLLKPIGDIFLNLLFTAVILLVFFAISSAIAGLNGTRQLSRIMGTMALVFLATVVIAALVTIVAIHLIPLHEHAGTVKRLADAPPRNNLGDQITSMFTTSKFYELLSRENMLALIIFSLLIGFATLRAGEKGAAFARLLQSGNEVFGQLFGLIMKMAPVGLGAYFAYQVGVFGPQLFGTYARSLGVYYAVGAVYYVFFFSLYAFIAGGIAGIKRYWQNNIIPSATAVGTCSSIATIPANLEAARRMGVPDAIASVTIPLGGTLHKEGSSISSIIKMAVVFAMFGKGLDSPGAIALALGMTVLVSMVEGGIPNGGYVGELLFISAYGLPPEALPPAIIIGTLVDPMATLLNATGDTVAAMLVTRFTIGKKAFLSEG